MTSNGWLNERTIARARWVSHSPIARSPALTTCSSPSPTARGAGRYGVKQGCGFVTEAGGQTTLIACRDEACARLGRLLRERVGVSRLAWLGLVGTAPLLLTRGVEWFRPRVRSG